MLCIVTVLFVGVHVLLRQHMLCILTVLFVRVHVLLQQYMLCIVTVLSRDSTCFIATVHVVYCDRPFCESKCCVLLQSFFVRVHVLLRQYMLYILTVLFVRVYVVYCDSPFCESTCCVL